ncbi:MAG: hypothetical protein P4L99_15840 [Chthoniobacter sp.]|nr:hypothetical protein [Chthoniobacter sp.]
MKAAFLLGLVLFPLATLQAADTAYSALRVIGKRDGQEVLNHVVELRGRSGTPQPEVWKIVIDDPRARGGVREVEVQRGKIVGERTPTSHGVSTPMNFNQLNLDSEGAFTIANQEAEKSSVPFDHVDYVLKAGTGGGVPVWQMDLLDGKSGHVGSIDIAADSGTVLRRNFDARRAGEDDHAYLGDDHRPPPTYRSPGNSDDSGYSQPGEPFRSVPDFFHRLGRRFEKRGHQLENFFTGKGGSREGEDH